MENSICYLILMPDVVFEKILCYFSYDAIAKNRIVCRRFNEVCKRLLNRGFYIAVQYHSKCFKEVKSQLPRRESKRPNHPLARHSNILNAIETRISLLKMTYCKYIHFNACCFIPGKVIDELLRVLNLVNKTKGSLIPHEVLTELRDISSMAMDYFEEKIVPTLRNPNSSPPRESLSPTTSPSTCSSHSSLASLNASMNATISSLNGCYGSGSHGDCSDGSLSALIGGAATCSFFPYADDVLGGEIKTAVSSLLPQQGVRGHKSPCLPTSSQLIPVPLETVRALLQAVKESKSKRCTLERRLTSMQSKLSEVCRRVQDQERTISEQSRLISEHSLRFTSHSDRIDDIINSSITAEVVDVDEPQLSSVSGLEWEESLMHVDEKLLHNCDDEFVGSDLQQRYCDNNLCGQKLPTTPNVLDKKLFSGLKANIQTDVVDSESASTSAITRITCQSTPKNNQIYCSPNLSKSMKAESRTCSSIFSKLPKHSSSIISKLDSLSPEFVLIESEAMTSETPIAAVDCSSSGTTVLSSSVAAGNEGTAHHEMTLDTLGTPIAANSRRSGFSSRLPLLKTADGRLILIKSESLPVLKGAPSYGTTDPHLSLRTSVAKMRQMHNIKRLLNESRKHVNTSKLWEVFNGKSSITLTDRRSQLSKNSTELTLQQRRAIKRLRRKRLTKRIPDKTALKTDSHRTALHSEQPPHSASNNLRSRSFNVEPSSSISNNETVPDAKLFNAKVKPGSSSSLGLPTCSQSYTSVCSGPTVRVQNSNSGSDVSSGEGC